MQEAYAVAVSLTMTSNVGPSLDAMSRQFALFDAMIKTTRDNLDLLRVDVKSAFAIGPAISEARTFRNVTEQIAKDAQATQRAYSAALRNAGRITPPAGPAATAGAPGAPGGPAAPGAGRGAAGPSGPSGHDYMMIGMASQAVGSFFLHQAESATKEGMTLGAARAGLLMQGFTPPQADQAVAAAIRAQQGIQGTSLEGDLGLISKLMAVVQDPEAAIKIMPDFARLGVVLDAQHKGGEGDALMSAIRSGEFRGVLSERDPATGQEHINTDRLARFVKEMMATSIATHGQIGPAQMYQFLKSGGVTASMIDDESLFADSMALQMAMGSSKAGTALSALGLQFGSGRMSSGAFELMQKLSMIADPSKAEKIGIGQYMLYPGAIDPKVADAATNRPADFITRYLEPHMKEFLHQSFGSNYDTASPEEQQRMVYRLSTNLASRQTGANEIVETIRNILLIGRDRDAFRAAMGRDAYGIQVGQNPEVALTSTTAAFKTFLAVMGDSNMKDVRTVLDGTTSGLNGLSDWAAGPGKGVAGDVMNISYALGVLGTAAAGWAGYKVISDIITHWRGGTPTAGVPSVGPAINVPALVSPGAVVKGLMKGGPIALMASVIGGYAEYYADQGMDWMQDATLGAGAADRAKRLQQYDNEHNHFWGDMLWAPGPETQHQRDVERQKFIRELYGAPSSAPGATGGGEIQLHGDLNIDGRKLGSFFASNLADRAGLPQAGTSMSDFRINGAPAFFGAPG